MPGILPSLLQTVSLVSSSLQLGGDFKIVSMCLWWAQKGGPPCGNASNARATNCCLATVVRRTLPHSSVHRRGAAVPDRRKLSGTGLSLQLSLDLRT